MHRRGLELAATTLLRYATGSRRWNSYWARLRTAPRLLKLVEEIKTSGTRCPFCGKRFRTRRGLIAHIFAAHVDDVVEIIEEEAKKQSRA